MEIKNDGFTLLEMMVTIAIIALLSVVFSQIFISTLRSNTKTEILKEVKQNGNLALESMTRMIQNATRVTCPSSQTLSIQNPDGNTTTLACAEDSTTTRIASSSASETVYLSSTLVSLGSSVCSSSTLLFTCDLVSGLPSRISIAFRLSQAGLATAEFEQSGEDFQTTVLMRNSP